MIKMIWCEDINHGIGLNNKLPWNIPEEMKHFRTTTLNQTILCGDKTFISWGGKPLPNRKNIILTIDKLFKAPNNCIVYNDLHQFIKDYKNEKVYICGGKTIYKLFFPFANELIITTLNKSYECNIFMNFPLHEFVCFKSIKHKDFTINYYKRNTPICNK